MEKSLRTVELNQVSYDRNKTKFQKKLKSFTFLTTTLMLMFFSFAASATHIRYLNLTWRPVSGNTVEFKFSYAQAGSLAVGTQRNFTIRTGAGFATVVIPTKVTSNVPSENYFYTEGTVQYTYPNAGNYTASFSSCCRISTLVNNRDGSVFVGTVVNVGTGNSSPIATLPPVVNVPQGVLATFTLPANDPDGDVLSYRLATPSEMGGGTNPSGLSVNPTTGIVTFNTANTSISQQYSAAIVVSDGKTSITVDFIIKITQQSIAPVFDYLVTPAAGTVFQVSPGQPVNFTLRATDSDAGDNVTLSGVGIPLGAITSPSLPTNGNPVQASFSWTPTTSNLGTNVVNFIAQDNQGVQTTTSVTIQVSLKPSFNTPPTPAINSTTFTTAGEPVNFTVQASDPDLNDQVQIVSATLPNGATLDSALPTLSGNPTSTNLTWTPTTSQWGPNTFNFTARDTYGDQTNHKFDYVVNTPPVITSTSPSTNLVVGQLFTYNITASDLDVPFGDELDFTSTQLPVWLSLVDNGDGTATLSGTPQISDVGTFSLTILAEDTYHHDGGVDSEILSFVVIPCYPTVTSISSLPTSTTYTGGIPTNLFLGYGAQSTTLQVSNVVSGGNGVDPIYTYEWSGVATASLSSTTSGSPVFTPTEAGFYNFSVIVTNKYGCKSTASISICVKDVREKDKNGKFTGKVYLTHYPSNDPTKGNTISISINAVPSHLSQHSLDRLGVLSDVPCTSSSSTLTTYAVGGSSTENNVSISDLNVNSTEMIAYPNPFGKVTTVRFTLPYQEDKATLDIYDLKGTKIQNLFNGNANAQTTYEVQFNGQNLSAGTYFFRLITAKEVKNFKVIMGE